MAEVGKNLKKIRKEKNLTQDDLAGRLHCTRQTISNYETGKSEPDIALLIELAGVLEVEIGDLIYGPKKANLRECGKRQKVRAAAALVTAGVLLAVIGILMPHAKEFAYHYFAPDPVWLLQYVLQPFALVLFGWGIAEAGWVFAGICIWKDRKRRTVRIIRICYYITVVILSASAVLALCTAVDLTYVWWKLVQTRKSQESFDHTTNWAVAFYLRAVMLDRLGVGWLFLGAALGFCKIDKTKWQEPDAGNTIEGQD